MNLVEQALELLEDFRAVGEQVWQEAEERAASLVQEGVARGGLGFGELESRRESLTRQIVLDQTVAFLTREGSFDEAEVARVMEANGQGFTEADLANLDDGILPERDTIEGFRVRALLAHYALVCDAHAIQSGLISGEGAG